MDLQRLFGLAERANTSSFNIFLEQPAHAIENIIVEDVLGVNLVLSNQCNVGIHLGRGHKNGEPRFLKVIDMIQK